MKTNLSFMIWISYIWIYEAAMYAMLVITVLETAPCWFLFSNKSRHYCNFTAVYHYPGLTLLGQFPHHGISQCEHTASAGS